MLRLLVVIVLPWLVLPAFAHEAPSGWTYPPQCCGDRDCQQIEGSMVKETPAGYVIDRSLVPYGNNIMPHQAARMSPDGLYHLCVSAGGTMLCFFAPPRSY